MSKYNQGFEYEIKYKLDIDVDINIESCNFTLISVKHQVDTYFMVNKFIDGKATYIRIREDLNKNKGSFDLHAVSDTVSTEEKEVSLSLDDTKKIKKALIVLGNEVICVVDKKRSTYERNGVLVMLDDVKNLGRFVEIEICAPEEMRDESLAVIQGVATQLGLQPKNIVSGIGYPDLLLEQNRVLL